MSFIITLGQLGRGSQGGKGYGYSKSEGDLRLFLGFRAGFNGRRSRCGAESKGFRIDVFASIRRLRRAELSCRDI